MKLALKRLTSHSALLVAAYGVLAPLSVAQCDPATVTPATATPTIVTPTIVTPPTAASLAPSTPILEISEIESDAALQVKVSVVAKGQPLGEVLLDLQKQSNLILTPKVDESITNKRVTAYIEELSIAQVLTGLSRLYGVRWTKSSPNTFEMLPSDREALEMELLQVGKLSDIRLRYSSNLIQRADRPNWSQEIQKYINVETLKSPVGESPSVLPPDLQAKLRTEAEEKAAFPIVGEQHALMEASINDYVLRVAIPRTNRVRQNRMAPQPQITVDTNNGKSFDLITPKPITSSPKPPAQNIRGRS